MLLLLLFSCHLNVFHSKCLHVTSYLFGSLTLFLKLYELSIPTKLSGHLFTMFYNYPHSSGEPINAQYSVCVLNTIFFPHPVSFCDSAQQPLLHKCLLLCSVLPPTAPLSYTSCKFSYAISSHEQTETAVKDLHSHDGWVHLKATIKKQNLKSHTVTVMRATSLLFPSVLLYPVLGAPYCQMLTKVHAWPRMPCLLMLYSCFSHWSQRP